MDWIRSGLSLHYVWLDQISLLEFGLRGIGASARVGMGVTRLLVDDAPHAMCRTCSLTVRRRRYRMTWCRHRRFAGAGLACERCGRASRLHRHRRWILSLLPLQAYRSNLVDKMRSFSKGRRKWWWRSEGVEAPRLEYRGDAVYRRWDRTG